MKLEEEINNLNNMLIKMADMVSNNLNIALSLYHDYSEEKASLINDNIVDLNERLIEETCMTILLKERPYAKDMRSVIGVLKLVEDIERLGDHAEDIETFAYKLKDEKKYKLNDVDTMIEKAMAMVDNSIKSFIKQDLKMANECINKDDEVDALYTKLLNEIVDLTNREQISPSFAIYSTLVVKYIERIADHASNIAEWVVYILKGYHKDRQIF